MPRLLIPTTEPFYMQGGEHGCVLEHGFTGAPQEMRLMALGATGVITPSAPLALWLNQGKGDKQDQEVAREHLDYSAYRTRSIAEVHARTKALQRCLPKISCPVLLVCSPSDQAIPHTHADRIKEHIGRNLCKSILLEDSGHVITEDKQKDFVFQTCADFIDEVTSK